MSFFNAQVVIHIEEFDWEGSSVGGVIIAMDFGGGTLQFDTDGSLGTPSKLFDTAGKDGCRLS